jgi:hypothetical protein
MFADRRRLVWVGSLPAAVTLFTAPAAAQSDVVGNISAPGRALIAVVFTLFVCGVLSIFLRNYTMRATSLAIDDIGTTLKLGLLVTGILSFPFALAGGLALAVDEIDAGYFALFGLLGPTLVLPIIGGGLGFITLGRTVSDNWLVVTAVVSGVVAVIGIGTVLTPTLVVAAVPLIIAGMGAVVREWQTETVKSDKPKEKPHPWEHRRP